MVAASSSDLGGEHDDDVVEVLLDAARHEERRLLETALAPCWFWLRGYNCRVQKGPCYLPEHHTMFPTVASAVESGRFKYYHVLPQDFECYNCSSRGHRLVDCPQPCSFGLRCTGRVAEVHRYKKCPLRHVSNLGPGVNTF